MILKRRIAILLAVFYMITASGFVADMHYCGGKLASVALLKEKPSCKMCSKMESLHQHNSCCKDDTVEVKIKDNHQAAQGVEKHQLFVVTLPAMPYPESYGGAPAIIAAKQQTNKAPPLTGQPSINILHCTFRI